MASWPTDSSTTNISAFSHFYCTFHFSDDSTSWSTCKMSTGNWFCCWKWPPSKFRRSTKSTLSWMCHERMSPLGCSLATKYVRLNWGTQELNLLRISDLPHRLMEDDVYKGMSIPKGSLVCCLVKKCVTMSNYFCFLDHWKYLVFLPVLALLKSFQNNTFQGNPSRWNSLPRPW